MKIAVLSNVNVNGIIKMLKQENYLVFENIGYGDIFCFLLDENSVLNCFGADTFFIIIDIIELLGWNVSEYKKTIDVFFHTLQKCIKNNANYFLSDIDFRFR